MLGIDDYTTVGDDLMGDDVLGYATGAVPRAALAARAARAMRLPRRPAWRGNQLAPGVMTPGEGMIPLPLTPQLNAGVFTAAITTIAFTARPQKPFHAERLLALVRRSGAAGVTLQCTSMFVGTDLQTAVVGNFDVENFGPTAFGVRLQLKPAVPGIDITLNVSAIPAPGGADTATLTMMFLGRYVG